MNRRKHRAIDWIIFAIGVGLLVCVLILGAIGCTATVAVPDRVAVSTQVELAPADRARIDAFIASMRGFTEEFRHQVQRLYALFGRGAPEEQSDAGE